MEHRQEVDKKKWIIAGVLLVIALLSVLLVMRWAVSAENHAATIQALDDKKATVMELTAASTAASAAITLIPGDTATPIAEKLADLTGYFLIVICAILLEKYLLTITGYVAFAGLIPAACVLGAVYMFRRNPTIRRLAIKMAAFGLALYCLVPASVSLSHVIERTYRESIEAAIDSAKEAGEEIGGTTGTREAAGTDGTGEATAEDTDGTEVGSSTGTDGTTGTTAENGTGAEGNVTGNGTAAEESANTTGEGILGIFSGLTENISSIPENINENINTLTESITSVPENVKTVLNRFIEALAVMLVTSCVIPVIVLLFFIWLIKIVLEVNLNLDLPKFHRRERPGTE